MTRPFALIPCLALMLFSASVRAADPTPDALIEQGLALRRGGKPEEALELFRRAHALAPSSRTFGQMGLVETSLKRWVEGENHLSVALSNPDDPWIVKNRAFLDEALGLCRQHVGDLVVSGPAGVEVFVGGRSVGTLPTVPAVRWAEGTVVVSASAPGWKPFEQTATIQAGTRTSLTIAMIPLAVAPPTPAAPPLPAPTAPAPAPMIRAAAPAEVNESSPSGWHTWVGVSLASAGAAALGWGITWIAIDNHTTGGTTFCTNSSEKSGTCPNVYDTRTPGWIIAGAGAAAIAGGAAIFFTGHAASSKVAVGLTPSSVLLQGRF